MDDKHITSTLNPAQLEAVTVPSGHVLVLAGAGSGKTRVLVHRITWLIQVQQVSPFSILAVTFTNKAANEMRHRIEALLGMGVHGMWIGTFHGLCHRMLRTHWEEARLPESFQIIDSEDQYRLIKKIHKELTLDETQWPPKKSQAFINRNKEQGHRAKDINTQGNPHVTTLVTVYDIYEQHCQRSGLVDFSELMLRSYELLQQHKELLDHYHQRFSHILIDEFQDTNSIQYAWIKLLAGTQAAITAVGDDDQSIYSWRGAQIENIFRFDREFPDVTTVRLEQNYRSTASILSAANAVIANNEGRLGKDLWTQGAQGEPVQLYCGFNDIDEANFMVSTITRWANEGRDYVNAAVLYRSNAQSRVIEEQLTKHNIPYRVYGGLRFFDRAEIKDALAYLRLVANRHDDGAFERIVNTPTRGIGHSSLEVLRQHAREHQWPLWETAKFLCENNALSKRALNALQAFLTLIDSLEMNVKAQDYDLGDHCELIVHTSGLIDFYRKDKSEKGISKVENLEELLNATRQFPVESLESKSSPIAAFLAQVTLDTGDPRVDQADAHNVVQLMTLHAAKGLEFPLVFLSGMEEGLFPHTMSANDPRQLEEERRLCYVGMTRAMEKLYVTYAQVRRIHGTESYQRPSRFIKEIPEELLNEVASSNSFGSSAGGYAAPKPFMPRAPRHAPRYTEQPMRIAGTDPSGQFQLGQRVRHQSFGEGVVLNFEAHHTHSRVQVKFPNHGVKWLLTQYANLEVLSG